MSQCFLCGAASDGPTCGDCLAGRTAASQAASPASVPPPDTDEPTGFEADTDEVFVAARPEPTLGDGRLATTPLEFASGPEPVLNPLPGETPGVPGHKKIERWNSILDASPVFAGQGAFEVQTPDMPTPGTLDVAIGAKFDVASAPADGDPVVKMLVTVSPVGAPLMAYADGPVAHVILALDLSGSMNRPDKYPLLTRALSGMFRDLKSKWAHEVLVSVVAFAWGSETILQAASSKTADPREVLRRLDTWEKRFTRYTDIVGALGRAGKIARDSIVSNKAMPVRIYVLTDGKPQDMPGARRTMELISKLPVDVHGLAFGDDADTGSLQRLVSGGRGGTVKHVRSDTIGDAFGRIGEVAQQVVANRALLDLELRPGVIGGEAFRHRPARHRFAAGSFVRGTKFSTDLGTLESGRSYTMLFELRLRRAKTTETEVGRITIRVPGFGGPRTFEKVIAIPRHEGPALPDHDPEVQAAADVLAALESDDPAATLQALRIRREIYANERRDPHVLFVIDKAILELEHHGSLAGLTAAEQATLVAHTLTTGHRGARQRVAAEPAGAPSA